MTISRDIGSPGPWRAAGFTAKTGDIDRPVTREVLAVALECIHRDSSASAQDIAASIKSYVVEQADVDGSSSFTGVTMKLLKQWGLIWFCWADGSWELTDLGRAELKRDTEGR